MAGEAGVGMAGSWIANLHSIGSGDGSTGSTGSGGIGGAGAVDRRDASTGGGGKSPGPIDARPRSLCGAPKRIEEGKTCSGSKSEIGFGGAGTREGPGEGPGEGPIRNRRGTQTQLIIE